MGCISSSKRWNIYFLFYMGNSIATDNKFAVKSAAIMHFVITDDA